MPNIHQLREKASELGYSFERGTKKGTGYVLIDANGDRPLGHDYTASLADIEKYLDNFADDLDVVDIEVSDDKESKPPPTQAEIQKSLRGHANANEIKKALRTPQSARQEQRDRIALDHLILGVMTARQRWAFDQLSEAEKEEYYAKVRAAMAEEERVKAAKLPKLTLPLRDFALNPDHPIFQERARQGRVFHKANQSLKTNIGSRADRDEFWDADAFNYFRDPEQSHQAWLEPDDEEKYFLPPEPGDYDPAPKPPATEVVAIRLGRLSKADRQMRRQLLKLREGIREALVRNDKAAAGAMLKEAKDLLGRGNFEDWVTREIEITARSAQRRMKAASG